MLMYYVAHPYSGKAENKDKVEAIIRKKRETDPNGIYISPIHPFGGYYDEVEYLKGLDNCLALLQRCDCILMCPGWELSAGCRAEKLHAEKYGIPVWYIAEGEREL
jgi:hypothetical protein